MPYAVIYAKKQNTVFTQPGTAASSSNYGEIVEGSNKSLWKCKRNITNYIDFWSPISIASPVAPTRAALASDVGNEVEADDGSIWTGYIVSTTTTKKWINTNTTTDVSSDPCYIVGATCTVLGVQSTTCYDLGSGYIILECQNVTTTTYGWQFVRDRQLCSECPPSTAGSFGDQCYCESLDQVYEYQEDVEPVYEYYWEKITDGFKDLIRKDVVKFVDYNITKRTFDDDTANKLKGALDNEIKEPVLFVLKDDKHKTIYAAYIKNWAHDLKKKSVEWKVLDFRSVLNTDIQLELYLDDPSDNLKWQTILNTVFNSIDDTYPEVVFSYANDPETFNPDTTMIANLWGQRKTEEARKFIKIYLAYYGYYLNTWFDESLMKINIAVTKNTNTKKILLKDFIFEQSLQDTVTNQTIATIKDSEESESSVDEIDWIPATDDYYNSQSTNNKEEGIGKSDNFDSNDFFNPSGSHSSVSSPTRTYVKVSLISYVTDMINDTGKFLLFLPYHEYFDFSKSKIGVDRSFHGPEYTEARLSEVQVPNELIQVIHLGDKAPFKYLGDGWFFIDANGFTNLYGTVYNTYVLLAIKNGVSYTTAASIMTTYKLSVRVAIPELQDNVEIYEFGKTVDELSWYLKPNVEYVEGEVPPYGYAFKATNTYYPGEVRYWQLGQKPVTPKNLPKKIYFLGSDNEIYEDTIPEDKKIYPVKKKFFSESYLATAQYNAILELVNTRQNDNVIIVDNMVLNPILLADLGLYAMITVYDTNNDSKVIPISEITLSNKEVKVKLGFKKILLTEIIKDKL